MLGDRGLGGFTGLLLGSVAVALSARAACPVVVVRGIETDPVVPRPEPVVVGVDGSPGSTAALVFAVEAAVLRGVPLVAVHAWRDVLVDPTMSPLVDWDAVESEEHEALAERLAGIGSATRTSCCASWWSATARPGRWSTSPAAHSSWWSARAVAAGCRASSSAR